ncbi:MAG: Pimeloyl-ACP methyl ester carboxylesterase, partial [Verrucomicrobia bacterium]|nr:Pimeloyl-ACP methyl ester carboxylesterase [Verrucomicrobiota bacterium]
MKLRVFLVLLGLFSFATLPAAETAPAKQPVLVSVHGAWAGGWQFKKTAVLLEAKGWKVYRPSLSGLGEHFNTASADIGLATHIDDIVNFILFEDLHDVILLGHSYGGMVITGVADRIPDRIGRLIYLDAFLPEDGESVMTIRKTGALDVAKMAKDGFIIPGWVKPDKLPPKDVPHPMKTFTDPIVLKNPAGAKVPGTYILTVDKGRKPEDDDFYPSSERAKARGWPVLIM